MQETAWTLRLAPEKPVDPRTDPDLHQAIYIDHIVVSIFFSITLYHSKLYYTTIYHNILHGLLDCVTSIRMLVLPLETIVLVSPPPHHHQCGHISSYIIVIIIIIIITYHHHHQQQHYASEDLQIASAAFDVSAQCHHPGAIRATWTWSPARYRCMETTSRHCFTLN